VAHADAADEENASAISRSRAVCRPSRSLHLEEAAERHVRGPAASAELDDLAEAGIDSESVLQRDRGVSWKQLHDPSGLSRSV